MFGTLQSVHNEIIEVSSIQGSSIEGFHCTGFSCSLFGRLFPVLNLFCALLDINTETQG